MSKLYAVIKTEKGDMKAELYPDVAPNTVLSFVELANKGFYNGLNFHRVVPGFVIQGGCPRGDGTGGPGYTIPAEFNPVKHELGVLSMARAGHPDSGGSQFFICLDKHEHLDNNYTVFGKVIENVQLAPKIAKGDKILAIEIQGDLPENLKGKELVKSGIKK